MKRQRHHSRRGAAVVALMIIAVIILGSLLSLNTAATLSVAKTSRALEVGRQNFSTAVRLEQTVREAAQSVFGTKLRSEPMNFDGELQRVLGAASLGALQELSATVDQAPGVPTFFPVLSGSPQALAAPSAQVRLFSTPALDRFINARGQSAVAESAPFTVRFSFSRPAASSEYTYNVVVKGLLVAVPLTRYGAVAYDLPVEIGSRASGSARLNHFAPGDVGPQGLVMGRDSAHISVLERPPSGSGTDSRPAHYRYLAALSETYEYVFSDTYVQRVADYAGTTHFIQIGAGAANPVLVGGSEVSTHYALDLGVFGSGSFGATVETRDAVVIHATTAGMRLVLTDSGASSSPMLLIFAGPAAGSGVGHAELEFGTDVLRPVVIVAYNVAISPGAGRVVNGALLLDRECSVSASVGPMQVGHVSFAAGGDVSAEAFTLQPMSANAEALAPRVVYAITNKELL